MSMVMADTQYKSPLAKLVRFFNRSRDQWKAKHQAIKIERKRLQNAKASIERSRNHWKQRAKDLQLQNKNLQRQLDAQPEDSDLKKRSAPAR